MKKTKLKVIILALIVIVLTVFAVWYFSGWKKPSDISRIEIESGSYYPYYYSKYIFDFKSNTVMITSGNSQDKEEKTRNFSDEDKENFVSQANIYGFFNWRKLYEPMGEVDDGGYKHFLTIYNDGSQHETWCENAYPLTCDEMWDVFFETIG